MMKIRLAAAEVTALIMIMTLASCGGPVGYWTIDEITTGDVVMTQDDAKALGFGIPGAFKLNKSGSCEIELLGDKYEGTWEQSKDGTITMKYGKDQSAKASIDDDNIMTATDNKGTVYKLSK
jgi:hypothetical protein